MSAFAAAQVVEIGKKSPGRKTETAEVALPGMMLYGAFCYVKKAIEGALKASEESVKSTMLAHFVTNSMIAKKKIDNFKGVEGIVSGSCQLKMRASSAPLTEEEKATLEKHNITVVPQESNLVETYRINPAYFNNEELLKKVAAALEGVEGLPVDFIELQRPEKKYIVGPDALNEVFATVDDRATVMDLVRIVGSLSITPTIAPENGTQAMALVAKIMTPPPKKKD